MGDILAQMWTELGARPDGPMALRFYLQPSMAIIFAVRDGLKDARKGTPPYLWGILTDPEHRRERVRDGWKSIGKVWIIALALDVVYQLIVLHTVRPLQGVLVATTLAILPYVLTRGITTRIAQRLSRARA